MGSSDKASAARRVRAALELFELGENLLRQRLRRERPDASESQIEAAVLDWRLRRYSTEPGDAPGRVRPWHES
jgi:hypothetical protein